MCSFFGRGLELSSETAYIVFLLWRFIVRNIFGYLFKITVFAFFCGSAVAQPNMLWSRHLYYAGQPTIMGACEMPGGGFAVVGIDSLEAAVQKVFVARLDSHGDTLWARVYGSSTFSRQATSVVVTGSGNLIVVGHTRTGSGTSSNSAMFMGVSADGDSLWTRTYFGGGQAKCNGAVAIDDTTFAAVGYRLGADQMHSDAWLVKFNAQGDTLWTRRYGGGDTDIGNKVLPGPSHGFLIAGQTRSTGLGDYDAWLITTDSMGVQQSAQTFGSTSYDAAFAITQGDSGLLMAGRMTEGNAPLGYVISVNPSGALRWARSITDNYGTQEFRGLVPRPGGGALCVGSAGTDANSTSPWIVQVNFDGQREQSWLLPETQCGLQGIIAVSDGGLLAFGSGREHAYRAGLLLRFPRAFGITGIVRSADTRQPLGEVHVQTFDGSRFAITNSSGRYTLDLAPGTYDLLISGECVSPDTIRSVTAVADTTIEVDFSARTPLYECPLSSVNVSVSNREPNTVPIWIYNYGSGSMDYSATVQSTIPARPWMSILNPSGVVAANDSIGVQLQISADTSETGLFDYVGSLTIRAHACNDSVTNVPVLVTVLDAVPRPAVAREFTLASAAPNPFNSATRISFTLPLRTQARITIFDLTGREVAVAADAVYAAGEHSVLFDGRNLATGVYFCRIDAAGSSRMKKMVLLK
jgi:hypothetical protein